MEKSLQLQKLQIGEVTSCDLNANYLLALGLRDKNLRILEWKVGLGFVDMFYSPLSFHKYGVTSVRFSPKGTMLASASFDGTATLIDVFTGSKIFTMVQHNTSDIVFCEFTFDCTKLITGANDGMLCFWDLVHHCQIRNCRLHEDDYSLKGIAISPDSEYLLSIDSGNLLKLWFVGDVIYNQPHCILLKKGAHDSVLCCDFSPVKSIIGGRCLKFNYSVVTCGTDGLIKVWQVMIQKNLNCEPDLRSLECDLKLLNVLTHDTDILCVRFDSRGNFIASTGLDNIVKLWEVGTGNCLKTLHGHTKYVTCATFSKDSLLLATGSIDRSFIIWDLSENLTLDAELLIPCNISLHFTNINVINYQGKVKDTDQEKRITEFIVLQRLNISSTVNSVQFQGDEVLAIAGGQKGVEIWKKIREKYEKTETLKDHKSSVNNLDISPYGGKTISCSADGMMIFWDLNMNLTYKMESPECSGSLKTCKFSPDSKLIAAAGDDQTVYLWDANNLEFIKSTKNHENAVTALAFTPDGKFLTSTCGNDIILHDLKQNKFVDNYNNAHDLGVLCCDFSPLKIKVEGSGIDEKRNTNYLLATGGNDSAVKLWKVTATKICSSKVLTGHGGSINYVKFSPAEPFMLASCSSDTTTRIWDAKRNHCVHVLNYHQSAVTTCSFSKDSTLLATGSLDKSVLIFNLVERPFYEPRKQNSCKVLENWTSSDIANWFLDFGCPKIAEKIQAKNLSGREVLSMSDDSIIDLLGFTTEKNKKQLKFIFSSLKKSLTFPSTIPKEGRNIPHKFLCPITHEIMEDPVICTDGYTYDRRAITEWFLSGKLISPITKGCLTRARLLPYSALKINIYNFLFEDE